MTEQDPTAAQNAGEHQGSTTTGEVVEDAQPKAAEPTPPDTQSAPTETERTPPETQPTATESQPTATGTKSEAAESEPMPPESEPVPASPLLEHLSDTLESAKHAADEALSPQRD